MDTPKTHKSHLPEVFLRKMLPVHIGLENSWLISSKGLSLVSGKNFHRNINPSVAMQV